MKAELKEKEIILLAPGNSIVKYKDKINNFIKEDNKIIISVNFIPEDYNIDYAFLVIIKDLINMIILNVKR